MSAQRKTAIARTIAIHSEAHIRESLADIRDALSALLLSARILQDETLTLQAETMELALKQAEDKLEALHHALYPQQQAAEQYRQDAFGHLQNTHPNIIPFNQLRPRDQDENED